MAVEHSRKATSAVSKLLRSAHTDLPVEKRLQQHCNLCLTLDVGIVPGLSGDSSQYHNKAAPHVHPLP